MNPDSREAQWAAWMHLAIAGDSAAYQDLLQALARWLRVIVRSRALRTGGGETEVEDAVQETLLAIHLKRHTWRRGEPVGPWVAAIARNKLVDQLRRRNRRAELPLDDLLESQLADAADEADASAGHDVARVLESLDGRQRQIVQLVAIEGHSSREAAGRLGMTEGALRVALHRSLRALAERLRNGVP